jgi:hypothetical protein
MNLNEAMADNEMDENFAHKPPLSSFIESKNI